MPFLPYSIRGEDYDVSKDESLNGMMMQAMEQASAEALGMPQDVFDEARKNPEDFAKFLEQARNKELADLGFVVPPNQPDHLGDMARSYARLIQAENRYLESVKEKVKTELEDMATSMMEDQSTADLPITHADVVKENVFIGSTPLDVIMEGIENQFDDYINMEDKTNYVDVFYDQLHASYEAANDDKETFKEDMIKTLDDIQQKFIDKIVELFNVRLTITITDVESESVDLDDLEFIIRRLYEFFILDARNNFKVAIASDAKAQAAQHINDYRAYMKFINNLMMVSYNPLITTFGPMEFLKYRGDQEMIQLFETGKVAGNFLRKYSPKFYKNEEFAVEVINYITMIQQIKEEVHNNGGQQ